MTAMPPMRALADAAVVIIPIGIERIGGFRDPLQTVAQERICLAFRGGSASS